MVNRDGVLKILDFGIARIAYSGATGAGATIGTANYMSPEHIQGQTVDLRSDVFAVGLVFYELLSRRQAFPGESPLPVVQAILTEAPVPLSTISPELSGALVRIVDRAIEKAPGRRYQDLDLMRKDLGRARESLASTNLEDTAIIALPRKDADSGRPRRGAPMPRDRSAHPLREELAARRTEQIEEHLRHAENALAAGRLEDALQAAEQAVFLDPDSQRTMDSLDRVDGAILMRERGALDAEVVPPMDVAATLAPTSAPGVSGPTSSSSISARILAGFRAAARHLKRRWRDRAPLTAPQVLLGVSAPHGANSGSKFVARFVAYVGEREIAVKQQLRDLDPVIAGSNRQMVLGLMPDRGGRWLVGTPVTVRVYGHYLTAEPPVGSFEWNGQENLVSFSIAVAQDAPATTSQLCFEAFIEGVPIAYIPLALHIGPGASEADRSVRVSHPASTAFASYASKDAPLVALCLSALKRWDPQIEIFMDCLDLTPNDRWQHELRQIIPSKDTFLLFWSTHARNSKWVAWELGIAETTRGLAFVRPMPIDPPEVAPPPDQLKHLQFRDRYLMARQGFLRIDEHRAGPA